MQAADDGPRMGMTDCIYLALLGLAALAFYLTGYYAGLRRAMLELQYEDAAADSSAFVPEINRISARHQVHLPHHRVVLPDPTLGSDSGGPFMNN